MFISARVSKASKPAHAGDLRNVPIAKEKGGFPRGKTVFF